LAIMEAGMKKQSDFLRRPLDWVFGAPGNVAVLRALNGIEHGLSGREIARRAGFAHGAVARAVADLEAGGLVERLGTGKTQRIRLNAEHRLIRMALLPLFEAEAKAVRGVPAFLREQFEGRAAAAVLRGPRARGPLSPGEAVDLLLVPRAGGKVKMLEYAKGVAERLRRRFGVGLEPVVLTALELKAKLRDRDPRIAKFLEGGVSLISALGNPLLLVDRGV